MYKEINSLNQVAEFHKTFEAPILETPQLPSEKRCKLRVDLMQEELDEIKDAIADNDIVEIADGLADLLYVLSGAVLEFGLGDKFVDIFNEVQRSNMSKACDNLEDANETVKFYKDNKNTEGYVKESNGKFIVLRTEDDKVLKNVKYSPADIPTFL